MSDLVETTRLLSYVIGRCTSAIHGPTVTTKSGKNYSIHSVGISMNDTTEPERWLTPLQIGIISWVLSICMSLAAIAAGSAWLFGLLNFVQGKRGMFSEHFAAVLGLPAAAGCSYMVIVTLKHLEGPIEFQGLSFKFKGASGQAILWIILTLGLVVAIKMLWQL